MFIYDPNGIPVRILRGLVALGIVGEIGRERYVSTPVSEAWTSPPLAGCTKHLFVHVMVPACLRAKLTTHSDSMSPPSHLHDSLNFSKRPHTRTQATSQLDADPSKARSTLIWDCSNS